MWSIPKVWSEAWIIGGGPSIREQFDVPDGEDPAPYMEAIHNRHIIGVNMAYRLGNWVDMMFFGDMTFLHKGYKEDMLEFPGTKVTSNSGWKRQKPWVKARVKYVPRDMRKRVGISEKPGHLSWNNSSGASAINLAYHMGARKIYLLGFDMHAPGASHWHTLYGKKKVPFHRHLAAFPKIQQDALRLGVEIINISPTSKIKAFEKATLKEVI